MSKALYMDDSYLKEFEAVVVSVKDDKFIVLDQTAFYPNGGGQPNDTGVLKTEDGKEYNVLFVGKFSDEISHEVDASGLKEGDKVHATIDWDRRYELMRYHTAAHLLSGVFHKECSAMITGNQLNLGKGRIDFSLDTFDREQMSTYFEKANKVVEEDRVVKMYYMPREEALKLPEMVKLAGALPPAVKNLRVIDIVDFDRQADGGTHVKSTKEVGKITFSKAENKGAKNRRIYFALE